VQAADAVHYPDPAYTALRQRLAAFHGVALERVLLAGSASEWIFRITAWAHQQGVRSVQLPTHHYGDYARAAQAWGLQASTAAGALVWACEPSSPLGQAHASWSLEVAHTVVLDRAYAPLRLSAAPSLSPVQLDAVWQLFTPNKALGLTGVRAAYVIAPSQENMWARGQIDAINSLHLLAPSWSVGAHGVALLHAWTSPQVQTWLAQCLPTLRVWKTRQTHLLKDLGWTCLPSEANYFCAQPPQPLDLVALRAQHGIKLRDCASFGLPGWVRLGVLPPQAQDALVCALQAHVLTTTVWEPVS
jgi:histidinol-phosphate aminotransferase